MLLFDQASNGPCTEIQPNLITMRIQPDEGISLRFGAKVPSPDMTVCPVIMDFNYSTAFGTNSANGYERLLLDAMLGDATLFAHRDGVEATWSLYTPVLDEWAATEPEAFPNYPVGSWGPKAADDLLSRDGRKWHKL
jgi:glucose-6-phosphate 1-dehydrogenase